MNEKQIVKKLSEISKILKEAKVDPSNINALFDAYNRLNELLVELLDDIVENPISQKGTIIYPIIEPPITSRVKHFIDPVIIHPVTVNLKQHAHNLNKLGVFRTIQNMQVKDIVKKTFAIKILEKPLNSKYVNRNIKAANLIQIKTKGGEH